MGTYIIRVWAHASLLSVPIRDHILAAQWLLRHTLKIFEKIQLVREANIIISNKIMPVLWRSLEPESS